MLTLDFRTLTAPLGILRVLEVIFTCITFSLVASVGHGFGSFWIWCMFTWCFCFCVTILILVLEFTSLSSKRPITWRDFTTAFVMLATLMVFSATVIYSTFYACSTCGRQIGASTISSLTIILYSVEMKLIRAQSSETRGFLSTVPGQLKVLEAFMACIIFICLYFTPYSYFPGLKWCVAVYSICFIFSFLVIILAIVRLPGRFPETFNKVMIVCNVLAVLMYITAVIIWPVYCFRNFARPNPCSLYCYWNYLVVVSVLSSFNLSAYIADTMYSLKPAFTTQT